jgi:hypothetical protein
MTQNPTPPPMPAKKAPSYRVVLEIADKASLPDIQKKINQWITTGLLIKFETQPMGDGAILFRILLRKTEQS